jgi:hypothetical protein
MEDRDLLKGADSGDGRVTAKGVIELTMRGEGGGRMRREGEVEWCVRKREGSTQTRLKYENRVLQRLDGGLKKGGGSRRKGERLCDEAGGLAKRRGACKVGAKAKARWRAA